MTIYNQTVDGVKDNLILYNNDNKIGAAPILDLLYYPYLAIIHNLLS